MPQNATVALIFTSKGTWAFDGTVFWTLSQRKPSSITASQLLQKTCPCMEKPKDLLTSMSILRPLEWQCGQSNDEMSWFRELFWTEIVLVISWNFLTSSFTFFWHHLEHSHLFCTGRFLLLGAHLPLHSLCASLFSSSGDQETYFVFWTLAWPFQKTLQHKWSKFAR